MKFFSVLCAALCAFFAMSAHAEEAKWLRYAAISPDGSQIAFEYQGDLWLVPSRGGEARPLTTHVAYEKTPVWSPDGKTIAFASNRHNSFDVFAVSAEGGAARRLTWHSAGDFPSGFTPDGREVLFTSTRLDSPVSTLVTTYLPELYTVSIEGGRARQILTTPAEAARFNPAGTLLAYQDKKGYENEWRKHHVSSVTRDLWTWNPATGEHRQITSFRGEDRNPVWSADGRTLYYLSEQGGSFNVWKMNADGSAQEQLTRHQTHPVRFLSAANDGTLCYAWDGSLWTKRPGAEPMRLAVDVRASDRVNPVETRVFNEGATDFAPSPNGEEVAFIVRGEIFAASVEHGTTKRITRMPEQERSLAWAPDGRTLYFAAERGDSWNLYKVSLARKDEEHFFNSTTLKEEPVLASQDETFQPLLSPDGKKIAYLHNRDSINVLDLASGKTKNIVPERMNYSYSDGDIGFEWAPDSKWLTFTYMPFERWIGEAGAANVETGEILNLTTSGYEEYQPHWSRDGKAVYFYSDRFGRRNHASWGSDGDVFALYLTQEAYDRAMMSREDFDLLQKKEEEEKGEAEEAKDSKDKAKGGKEKKKEKKKEEEPPKPVVIDTKGIEKRLRRLTMHSAPIGGFALSPDGEALVYFAEMDGAWDLWMTLPRDGETKKLVTLREDGPGQVVFSKEGDSALVLTAEGRIMSLELGGALAPSSRKKGGETKDMFSSVSAEPVSFAAEMTIHTPEERAYMFDHVWRQTWEKFYQPGMHGADWKGLKTYYKAFLPHVANGFDFAELLSEMLGELNASHTGSGHWEFDENGDQTAALGLLYDTAWTGDGLRVAEVLENGPCDLAPSKIKPGAMLTKIDGEALSASVDPARLLDRKAGKPVLLSLQSADGKSKWEEVVKPVGLGEESELLYRRWTKRMREMTEKLSGGTVGYVHCRDMDDASFREIYKEVLGRNSDKKALILDTRFNGGGWLHDDLVKFLSGEEHLWFDPRGKKMGSEPLSRWARPVAVLISEGNYSDAHVFPYAFHALRVGKLVGTPVAGTGTAVWWENLLDPSIYFGIPQVGLRMPDGGYLENTELMPDYLVYNDPASTARGEDRQLEKAVEVLMEEVKAGEKK
jgi:Tol biopolymer transport system component